MVPIDDEIKMARDIPTNSKNWLNTTIRIKSNPVFTVGTNQIFLDSLQMVDQ